ncbi:MAG TPA: hypothetical protein VGL93_17235 [Streptosporangiaceae bacterium]|jgi:hypothetical protein
MTTDLDADHIASVCAAVATRPSTLRASGDEVTLLFPDERQRDLATQTLARVGYATRKETGPTALQVTGWSSTGLADRATALRDVATELDHGLADAADRALQAAITQPTQATHDERTYGVAIDVSESAVAEVIDRTGPLARPALPPDGECAEPMRNVQRETERVVSIIGDHFNIACAVARRYAEARHDHAEQAARDLARTEGELFLTNRIDPDAFITALTWAHQHNQPDAAAFAEHYAQTHMASPIADRPPPELAYADWRTATPSPPTPRPADVAATDFPNPPAPGSDAAPAAAPNTTQPRRTGRTPGGPR